MRLSKWRNIYIHFYLSTGNNNMLQCNFTNLGIPWMSDDDVEDWNDLHPNDPYQSWQSPYDLVIDGNGDFVTRHQQKTNNYNSDVWGTNHNSGAVGPTCKWSSWSAVGGCSTNCGTGVQRYTRQSKGSSCWGSSEKNESCTYHHCQGTFYNQNVT